MPRGVLLRDVARGRRPPRRLHRTPARRPRVHEHGGARGCDGLEHGHGLLRPRRGGEAVRRKADPRRPVRYCRSDELGLVVAGQGGGVAAHQPKAAGRERAASFQAAIAARASRGPSDSAPTGDESATSARSTPMVFARSSGWWSAGSISKNGYGEDALRPEVLVDVDGRHAAHSSVFSINLVDFLGFMLSGSSVSFPRTASRG